ncbi:hypothetical protein [Flectobacillus longus]|uniref:hypothetical protein n=1 Tax=Flectobacillus longus TaxID=2984207 RepID=UPI0024B7F1AC|nr:hypothetical protein [Flectobacillus longus]MDI9878379.1 hypothetical protein [Flectobacillus longus]
MKNFGFYFFAFCILVIAIGLGSLLGVYVFLKLISKNVTKKDLEDRENQIIQEAQEKAEKGLPAALESYVQGRLVELEESEESSINDCKRKSANELSYVKEIVSFFQVGMPLLFPENNYENGSVTRVLATCLEFRINPTKDKPFSPSNIGLRIAIASSRRLLSFPSISGSNSERIFSIKGTSQKMPQNYSFVRELLPKWETAISNNSKNRSIRYIVTGNLIQAYVVPTIKISFILYKFCTNCILIYFNNFKLCRS